MENQLSTDKQPNQVVKKEWITPEMEEINVNGGRAGGIYESSTTMGLRGMLSK